MARVRLSILDQFLQHRIEHASQEMKEALRDALSIAGLPTPLGVNDSPPFPLHRRLAEDALNRLTYQITYLEEWQKRLSCGSEVIPAPRESPKKVVMSLRNDLKSERRAS
jgi:hypothetical protein